VGWSRASPSPIWLLVKFIVNIIIFHIIGYNSHDPPSPFPQGSSQGPSRERVVLQVQMAYFPVSFPTFSDLFIPSYIEETGLIFFSPKLFEDEVNTSIRKENNKSEHTIDTLH